jgi:hypothetical protein
MKLMSNPSNKDKFRLASKVGAREAPVETSRRTLLGSIAAVFVATFFHRASVASKASITVRHILPTVTDTQFAISVSLFESVDSLSLRVDHRQLVGQQEDTQGYHWSFLVELLAPDTEYTLRLMVGKTVVGEPWPLKTFPAETSLPLAFSLLAFTCAGGGDGFGTPKKQFFKPHAFRQRMFQSALSLKPDAAIAIGDHVYWDLRGGGKPEIGRNSVIIKYLAAWYLKFKYGEFDRTLRVLGTKNEAVLKRIGDEQIADLYGTRFKSTPVYFVSDDHDYFENDDAEDSLVTFPPDRFSRAARDTMAKFYYPPLPKAPYRELNRSFGSLVYGRLFEAPIFDCAGHLTLAGGQAVLVPQTIEKWLIDKTVKSPAIHFALAPSHPFAWTAGKWREWYPDVVAPIGFKGVVKNELLGNVQGQLTAKAQKYLWQRGWWNQHQRLLGALSKRPGSRFVFSGDIHAQSAVKISKSGSMSFEIAPISSFLVGPVSTSEATWPSAARGISAAKPDAMTTTSLMPVKEVNGFTVFEFTRSTAKATLFDCGGYDLKKNEDGRVISYAEILIE